FNANGWAITHADRNGNTNDLRYTTGGDLAAITDSQGRVTTLGWDDQGRPTEVTDPTGEETARSRPRTTATATAPPSATTMPAT
ncbi:hypothetical protein DSY14_28630, partial [Nocardiopsis sp. MG754419]